MKKLISVMVLVTTTVFCVFPLDKYELIANKTCQTVTGESLGFASDSSSKSDSGLTTGEKVAVGALALGAAALLGAALLSKDKYEKIADKAYEATKSE